MSTFGKVLLVFNLLGTGALVYLGSMSYAARQQWAYAVHVTTLMINGLPVDEAELDPQGQPAADQVTDETVKYLFEKVGGNPVPTQVAEVNAVKTRVDARVRDLEANKRQQAYVLAGILLPMSDSLLERDEYLATQAHLASDAGLKALEARYVAALRDAKKEGASGPDRPFHQAFRLGVRSQGGAPSDGITSLIVAKLPTGPDAAKADINVAKLFADALEAQRLGMQRKLERMFLEAMTNADQAKAAPPGGVFNDGEAQRAAIARLLIGLSISQANDAIEAEGANHPEQAKFVQAGVRLVPGSPAWMRVLFRTEEFQRRQRRVFVVSGVKHALNAISARAAALRLLASQVDAAASDERLLFMSDLAALLDEAREQASLVDQQTSQITENVAKIATQQGTVALRANDVKKAEEELKASVEETDRVIASLRAETEKARAARVKARDLLGTLNERERTIQELERQVLEAEAKSR